MTNAREKQLLVIGLMLVTEIELLRIIKFAKLNKIDSTSSKDLLKDTRKDIKRLEKEVFNK